jgi:hypothetical protein
MKHLVILPRQSASQASDVQRLLSGHPDYEVVVDRRRAERRGSGNAASNDNRRARDRRSR